jgi:CubicO group peptidase (beta-lactamase class C family)
MAQLPQLTPLGTVWSYNNAALALAGRVIEVLTEKTYEAALKELVLLPLGLKQSFLFPTEVMVHRFAVGHASSRDRTIVLHPWQLTRASAAEGGITASVIDLLRYARFHLGDGTNEEHERILSSESVRLMQTPICPATCGFENGLVWRLQELDGVRRVFHGGGPLVTSLPLYWYRSGASRSALPPIRSVGGWQSLKLRERFWPNSWKEMSPSWLGATWTARA